MRIGYVKLSPTGNLTILVETPVAREDYARVANELMREDCVGGEQVGFIVRGDGELPRLEMMGGEFCGNATMSLAALLAEEEGLQSGLSKSYSLQISGAEKEVSTRIERREEGFWGAVEMPLPKALRRDVFDGRDCPLVVMEGIAHLIVRGETDAERAEAAIEALCRHVGEDAMGIHFYDEVHGAMTPLVYVSGTRSKVWESACASGTAALACALAHERRCDVCTDVREPGGTLRAEAQWRDGTIHKVVIGGRVEILRRGIVELKGF